MLVLPVGALAAENDFDRDRPDPRNALGPEQPGNAITAPSTRVSRGQAMNIARSRYEGQVLSILLDNNTNNWRVRMDRDGTVFNVFINASSGDVSATSD